MSSSGRYRGLSRTSWRNAATAESRCPRNSSVAARYVSARVCSESASPVTESRRRLRSKSAAAASYSRAGYACTPCLGSSLADWARDTRAPHTSSDRARTTLARVTRLTLRERDVGDAEPLPRRHVDHAVVRPVAVALHPQPVWAGGDLEVDLRRVPHGTTVEVHAPPRDGIH